MAKKRTKKAVLAPFTTTRTLYKVCYDLAINGAWQGYQAFVVAGDPSDACDMIRNWSSRTFRLNSMTVVERAVLATTHRIDYE